MDWEPVQVATWPMGASAATECRLGFAALGARTPGMVLGAGPLAVNSRPTGISPTS